jgi:site-specific DNA recombinase
MPSTNGHGPLGAVLYARVSGEEQAKKGYSLADQLDTLRHWCSENDYRILEEVQDKGFSGAYLERPGLDKIREMVAGGNVDAVVVLFRDRIARGVYAQLLSEEFREYGARLVALNSRGDDSPDGELGDNILDVIAAWERKKIAERMNRGKRRKAREGKVVAGPRPNYGFRFNEKRDGYLVDEDKMVVVRRIFRMVGAEGMVLNTARCALEKEGIPTPSGRRAWSRQYLRDCIYDDAYLSHTFEEISRLVTPQVASTLDPSRNYGVWWYGAERHVHAQRREVAPDGTPRYRRVKKSVPAPREEWIAVPVPDAGVPKEWAIAAREAIKDNEWISNAGDKVWELSGGVIRCAECGRAMTVNHVRAKARGYYRCTGRYNGGIESRCSMSHTIRADEAETRVWEFVSEILTNPQRLARGLEKMLEDERWPSAAGEDETPWLKRIAELDLKQERLLDLHLNGDITTEQFRAKSGELEEARLAAEGQLESARSRLARLKDLERSKEALISHYASLVPQVLTELSSEEKNRIYKTMHFHVLAKRDGTLIADWGRNILPLPPGSCRTPGR